MKLVVATLGCLVAAALPIGAQSATPPGARFEVASIKRSANCNPSDNIYGTPLSQSPGSLTLNCATVKGLILGAYSRYAGGRTNLSLAPPVQGGPAWIDSERYTIEAKSAGQQNGATMNGPMLQALFGRPLPIENSSRDAADPRPGRDCAQVRSQAEAFSGRNMHPCRLRTEPAAAFARSAAFLSKPDPQYNRKPAGSPHAGGDRHRVLWIVGRRIGSPRDR